MIGQRKENMDCAENQSDCGSVVLCVVLIYFLILFLFVLFYFLIDPKYYVKHCGEISCQSFKCLPYWRMQ